MRTSLKAGLAGVTVAAGLVLFASPAMAHGVTVSGSASCAEDGSWIASWAITPSNNHDVDIVGVSASDESGAIGLSPGVPAPPGTPFYGSSWHAAGSGSATVQVSMDFANGEHRRASATVYEPTGCMPEETTTTTVPEEPTTTTVPEETTTTVPTVDTTPTTTPTETTPPTEPPVETTTPQPVETTTPAPTTDPAPVTEVTPTTAASVLAEQATTTTIAPAATAESTVETVPELPYTGAPLMMQALLGMLALVAGVAVAATAHRRRRATVTI